MIEGAMPAFTAWESFYVIVGSSGAALTGLQFVVIALIADSKRAASPDTLGAFGTPNIVHFGGALFIAAVLTTPWRTLASPAIVLALAGAGGIVYIGVVTVRARRQTGYKPVLEDWVWHNILPFVSYTMVFAGGILLARTTVAGLFSVATASLLLLFIGIHNAWDTVTYLAIREQEKPEPEPEPFQNGGVEL
jgi:uncharacterized membrane protein SirB2